MYAKDRRQMSDKSIAFYACALSGRRHKKANVWKTTDHNQGGPQKRQELGSRKCPYFSQCWNPGYGVDHVVCVNVCSRDVREWLSTFPFPPIPILSVLKLYIISDTVIIYYHYAQTRTRGRINCISVVGKLGISGKYSTNNLISSSQHKTFGDKFLCECR